MSKIRKTGSVITWPARQLGKGVRQGIGPETIRSGSKMITEPLDRRNRPAGFDPDYLKKLDGDSLLRTLNVDPKAAPRLIRTLRLEIVAWFGLFCLGFSNVVYLILDPQYSLIAAILGGMIGIVSFLQILLRHHWLLIVRNRKYHTFREYLAGRE